MNTFDYEGIWTGVWGDMQKYGPVHRHHRRIFTQLLDRIPRGEIETIADIGCGEGSNLHFLGTQFPGARLHGFDVSTTAMEAARANVRAEFSILDIQKEAPPRKFDLVFCSDVVEHLENDLDALKNMNQITRKYALVATVQGRMRRNESSIGHVRNYARGELQRKMETAGFEILQIVEWGFPFYSPLFRDLIGLFPGSEEFSYGRYNAAKKIASHILYALFLLNRSDKGDVIFALAKA
jgi:trans-aconitate methyltransferase